MTERTRRASAVLSLLAAAALVASAATAAAASGQRAGARGGFLLVQYAASGTPLPTAWRAHLLSDGPSFTTAAGPRAAPSIDGGVQVAFRNPKGHAIWMERSPYDHFADVDLTQLTGVGPLDGVPVPVVGPGGRDQVFCVTTSGRLFELTWLPNVPIGYRISPPIDPLDVWGTHDLTSYGGPTVVGTPSVVVHGATTYVFARTGRGHLVEYVNEPLHGEPWTAYDLSRESGGPTIESDPAGYYDPASGQVRVAATELAPRRGDLVVYAPTDVGGRIWAAQDVTEAAGSKPSSGGVAAATDGTEALLFAPGSSGDLMEFTGTDTPTTTTWVSTDLTASVQGAPAVAGTPAVAVAGSHVAIAAVAEGWGDLFEWDASSPAGPFVAADVSDSSGGPTRTIAGTPAIEFQGAEPSVFGAGATVPAPEGTGVYAIPSADWPRAIKDGWPLLGVTGGLGTRCPPWVGYADPTASVQPDELVGATIQASHVRETWLSFWTVSGPGTAGTSQCANERPSHTTSAFYDHGYAAGRWVATQIDGYRAAGVFRKPDWVIFDPEGYPDDQSGLIGPTSPRSKLERSIADWYAILRGWARGIASVDPALKAGLYADQYEYMTYHLFGQPLPTFIAGAFAEQRVKGHEQLVVPTRSAFGANIRGFIMLNENFTPSCAQLDNEAQLVSTAPWYGDYNTVQTSAGSYCPPGAADALSARHRGTRTERTARREGFPVAPSAAPK